MRVTIGELVEEFIPHTEKENKITQVEIVPRKIVEDIIEFCREGASYAQVIYMTTTLEMERIKAGRVKNAYDKIRAKAEEALEAFENGGDDHE
jgi:hypothetical protein